MTRIVRMLWKAQYNAASKLLATNTSSSQPTQKLRNQNIDIHAIPQSQIPMHAEHSTQFSPVVHRLRFLYQSPSVDGLTPTTTGK
jgi:hypothetical protein